MTFISLAMIVRDDESTLEECLKSIRPHVQEICILDTGSVDSTPEIAQKYADKYSVFLGANDPETHLIADFAMARNESFRMVSPDATAALWLDGDDVVRGAENLATLAEKMPARSQMLFEYEYARDAEGRVTTLQMRERLMKPHGSVVWRSPVHEYASIEGEEPVTIIASHDVVVEHRSHLSKKVREPGRNLRILKNYVDRVGEADVRALYYLGIEYATAGDMAQALRWLRRYEKVSAWDDERCRALLWLAEYYLRNGDYEMAVEWAMKAKFTKSWPEPWFIIGRACYAMAHGLKERPEYNYRRAAYHFMKGLDHPTDVVLFANPMERYHVHEFLNVCFNVLGDQDKALWSCEEGLKGLPGHPDLENNRRAYLQFKRGRAVAAALDEMAKEGDLPEMQIALAKAALNGTFRHETEASRPEPTKDVIPQPVMPGKLDVVLFLGPAYERWTPETWAETGMGGSETMALHMATRLRKLGHRVRFYTDCTESQQGVYEGVEWLRWQKFRDVKCDVLIASRFPWAVDDNVTVNFGGSDVTVGGCKATARLLWVHDVSVGPDLDLRRATRYDRILCLSEWHRTYFRLTYSLPGGSCPFAEKVHVTRNGIDLSRFEGSEERNPHRAVYASSPDRGLLALLQMWPKIREQVPDAELHVFYGTLNWEKGATMSGNTAELGQIAHLKQLLKTTQGVTYRERINQKELAREFMKAGVMASPTWFSETFGIAFAEAQAAGLYIVTSAIAALNETVADRGVLLEWESDGKEPTEEYKARFVEEVVKAMRRAELGPNLAGLDYAHHFGLDELAAEWDREITALHAELKENVMPKFSGTEAAQ